MDKQIQNFDSKLNLESLWTKLVKIRCLNNLFKNVIFNQFANPLIYSDSRRLVLHRVFEMILALQHNGIWVIGLASLRGFMDTDTVVLKKCNCVYHILWNKFEFVYCIRPIHCSDSWIIYSRKAIMGSENDGRNY